tara:strand:+ start:7582 stop:8256 length:675 start_codon:yes stop_codon:yes gene_type:complete
MTLNEIIYDIREKLKFNTEDIGITDEYLAHLINIKRNFLVKQRFSKFTRNIPEELKQIICVNLEVIDSIVGTSCFGNIVRSSDTIPTMLEIGGRESLIAVRVQDILYPHINIIPTERLPFVGHNRWLQKQVYASLDADAHLYLKSQNIFHSNIEKVKVIGVFADPELVYEMNCDSNTTCEYFDSEYPMEPYLVSDLVLMVVKELAPTLQIPNDKVNNSDESDRQ